MKNIDDSQIAFANYKASRRSYVEKDLSEADTRSKLIDSLLLDVLGWDEEDIRREGHNDAGFYDYRVSIPGFHFMIEAKKQFNELSLPTNHKSASINSLLKGNKDVIEQLRGYSIEEGIPYGIITNGHQFIFAKALNTDGKNWKENSCLIFNGIDDIERRFIEFYDNLSKHCIVHTGGFKFDLPINQFQSKTLLNSLVNKDKELVRNPLNASIIPLLEAVFGEIYSEDVENDLDFIKNCFIENEETKKNKNEIERLFLDVPPEIKGIVPAVNFESVAKQIGHEISQDDVSIKNLQSPKPIIVIGSKGAGKTTFINHLFKYKLSEDELGNHFVVFIDFRKFFESEANFSSAKLTSEILERIYSNYEVLELHSLKVLKRIYIKEIRRNDESDWEWDKMHDEAAYNKALATFLAEKKRDVFKHFELLSKYLLRERRKRLIVIIDNADQFKDSIQEQLFVYAQSLTRSSLCGTVISLREGYYYKWQNLPPFDAYESNVYHVTAPNYVDVLQKRIDFALSRAHLFEKKIRGKNASGVIYEFPANYIESFLSTLKTSLFSTSNNEIIEFLNYTTYPNIREGLKEFKSFLISGHTKVADYILHEQFRVEKKSSYQVIPLHEFIKSIAVENRHYYNSEISRIVNLFIPAIDSADHFLNLYILFDLNDLIESKQNFSRYVSSNIIIEKLTNLGYKINTIYDAIGKLIKNELIDSDIVFTDVIWKELKLPNEFNIGITLKGHYYFKKMIYRFHYLDIIVQDSPIFADDYYAKMKAVFPESSNSDTGKRNIQQRITLARLFLQYLKLREQAQPNQIKAVFGLFAGSIEHAIENEIRQMPIAAAFKAHA